MATAYWNFATDKPTADTNLKSDWGEHVYQVTYRAPAGVSASWTVPRKEYTISTPAWTTNPVTWSTPGARGPAVFKGWALSFGAGVVGQDPLTLDPAVWKANGQLGDKTVYALFDRYWRDIAFMNDTTGIINWSGGSLALVDIYINGSLYKANTWGGDFYVERGGKVEIRNVRMKDTTTYQYNGPSVIVENNVQWSGQIYVHYKNK